MNQEKKQYATQKRSLLSLIKMINQVGGKSAIPAIDKQGKKGICVLLDNVSIVNLIS